MADGAQVCTRPAVCVRDARVSTASIFEIEGSAADITCGRVSTFIVAFYYPVFYLQLDALNHGLSDAFSFYAVRAISIL